MENKDARSDQNFVASVKAMGLSSAAPGFSVPDGPNPEGHMKGGKSYPGPSFQVSHISLGTHPLQQEGCFQCLPGY